MINNFLSKYFWLPFTILHLPFVFSDAALWDSLVQTQTYHLGNFYCSTQFSFDSGVPLSAIIWQLGRLPYSIYIFKIALLVCYIIAAHFFRTIVQRLFGFDDFYAFVAVNIAFLFPAYSMWYHIIMLPYVVSLVSFFAAIYWYIRKYPRFSVPDLLLISVLSIVAFNIRSFLVFHLALLFCIFIIEIMRAENRVQAFAFFIQRNLMLIILPFVYFILLSINFPLGGLYKIDQYNVIQFSIIQVLIELGKSIVNTMFTPFFYLLKYLISDWVLILVFGVLFSITFLFIRRQEKISFVKFNWLHIALLLFLFLSALVPYALVGKHVSTHGYETRHSLLAIFPLVILVVVLLQRFFSCRPFMPICMAVIATAFFYNEILWQNRFFKYEWTVSRLKAESPKLSKVVFFEDEADIGMLEYFRFYECNILLQKATGTSEYLGISEPPVNYNSNFVNNLSLKYNCCKQCLFFEEFNDTIQSQYSKVSLTSTGKNSEVILWAKNALKNKQGPKLPLKLEVGNFSF